MSFGNWVRRLAPIAASALGGPAAGALVGGAMGMWGSHREARAHEKAARGAGQTAMGAHNYMAGSPVGQAYLPAGGAAISQQQALLGIGGDQAAAQEAYQNYLNSIGFQHQLQTGQQAITGSAAARGALGSGATLKALQQHGQNLGAQSFSNYLSQLGGVAGMGLQAGGMLGTTAMQGYGDAGRYQYMGGTQAAQARGAGWDRLMGGMGDAYDAWRTGRQTNTPPRFSGTPFDIPTFVGNMPR